MASDKDEGDDGNGDEAGNPNGNEDNARNAPRPRQLCPRRQGPPSAVVMEMVETVEAVGTRHRHRRSV